MLSRLAILALPAPLLSAQDLPEDQQDHPKFAHAMAVNTTMINGAPVVFQYGEVRPDFEALAGSPSRKRTSLDGEWELRFEDSQKTHSVTIPHCWSMMEGSSFWKKENSSSDNPARYIGAGWYHKVFEATPDPQRRYRLEFRGVRERARILLNGKEIAMHEGIGAPFSLDVTQSLKPGKNELRLKPLTPELQTTGTTLVSPDLSPCGTRRKPPFVKSKLELKMGSFISMPSSLTNHLSNSKAHSSSLPQSSQPDHTVKQSPSPLEKSSSFKKNSLSQKTHHAGRPTPPPSINSTLSSRSMTNSSIPANWKSGSVNSKHKGINSPSTEKLFSSKESQPTMKPPKA